MMTNRFRMVAGPNGSGKSTLVHRLSHDYAVNFYDFLNADNIFAEVRRTGTYLPRVSVNSESLNAYAENSSYDDSVKDYFREGRISAEDDCVRFHTAESVNSYTVALLTNYLQATYIRDEHSFSQETVFSHPSKVEALAAAREAGFRTYLYFVATENPTINIARVAGRSMQGGHDVPTDKIAARFERSLALLPKAFKFLSRGFFFDNSGKDMSYLGEWNPETGWTLSADVPHPKWFKTLIAGRAGAPRTPDSPPARQKEATK